MAKGTETSFETWIKDMPRATLGGLIKEYVAESNHGGWEGFGPRDMTGIRKLFDDLKAYYDNSGSSMNFGTTINNVNPVP